MERYAVCAASLLGGREEQQDAYCLDGRRGEVFAAVCDGIGGLPNGAQAAGAAIRTLRTAFLENPHAAPAHLYAQAVDWTDRAVAEHAAGGGTTVVSVWIRGDTLSWLSIGDSGLYLLREGQLRRLAQTHTYAAYLRQRLEKNEITQLYYDREIVRGRALTSYLGMNGVSLYEQNRPPMTLLRDDVLLLCSDGLTQAVPEAQLQALLREGGSVRALTKRLCAAFPAQPDAAQDNATWILIKKQR